MTLVLVGLPGSGKSSVGRQLGRRLNLPFVDSDTRIEQHIGCSIRDYFEREGEASFRDIEQTVLAELVPGAGGVIATGGGSVLREANRRLLQQNSHVIYLRSSPEDLFRRLRHDVKRPLLQVADPLGRLRELHSVRDPFSVRLRTTWSIRGVLRLSCWSTSSCRSWSSRASCRPACPRRASKNILTTNP